MRASAYPNHHHQSAGEQAERGTSMPCARWMILSQLYQYQFRDTLRRRLYAKVREQCCIERFGPVTATESRTEALRKEFFKRPELRATLRDGVI